MTLALEHVCEQSGDTGVVVHHEDPARLLAHRREMDRLLTRAPRYVTQSNVYPLAMADDLKRTQKQDVLGRISHKTQRFPSDAQELHEIAPELAKETDDPLVRFEILLGGLPLENAKPERWIDAAGKAWHVLRAQRPDVARRLAPAFGDAVLFSCDDALPPPAFEWTRPRGEVILRLARADRDGLRHTIERAFSGE